MYLEVVSPDGSGSGNSFSEVGINRRPSHRFQTLELTRAGNVNPEQLMNSIKNDNQPKFTFNFGSIQIIRDTFLTSLLSVTY